MPKIEIYSKDYCPYCKAAKRLLGALNWRYQEFEVTGKPQLQQEMVRRSQRRTVPQIFIDNRHIGGFDDFAEYIQQKQLL